MKKTLFLALALMLLSFGASAQSSTKNASSQKQPNSAAPYEWSIGGRINWSNAVLSFRNLKNDENAYDYSVMADFSRKEYSIAFLYEFVKRPFLADGLELYYGSGLMLGTWRYYDVDKTKNKFMLGLMGVAGIEYKFDGLPIAFFADYRPAVYYRFGSYSGHRLGWYYSNLGVGVRLTF